MRSSSPSSCSSLTLLHTTTTCSCPGSLWQDHCAAAPVVLAVTMRQGRGITAATSFRTSAAFSSSRQARSWRPSAASAFSAQAANSVLLLNQSEAVNASVRSRLSQSARPSMSSRPGVERIVVTLRRGPTGGLGLGLSPGNFVNELHPGSPAEACGMIERADQLISVNGQPVEAGQPIGPLLPRAHAIPIEFVFLRELGESLPPSVRGESGRTDEEGPEEIGEEESDEAIATQLQAEEEDIAAAVAQSNIFDDAVTPINSLAAEMPLEDDEVRLLEPSGLENDDELEEEVDEATGQAKSRLISTSKEQRAAAISLLVEPLRQGFCDACGKRALTEALPVLLTMVLTLFDSQTQSKLTIEELMTPAASARCCRASVRRAERQRAQLLRRLTRNRSTCPTCTPLYSRVSRREASG